MRPSPGGLLLAALLLQPAAARCSMETASLGKLFEIDSSSGVRGKESRPSEVWLAKACDKSAVILQDGTEARALPFAPGARVTARYDLGERACVVDERSDPAASGSRSYQVQEPGGYQAARPQGAGWLPGARIYIEPACGTPGPDDQAAQEKTVKSAAFLRRAAAHKTPHIRTHWVYPLMAGLPLDEAVSAWLENQRDPSAEFRAHATYAFYDALPEDYAPKAPGLHRAISRAVSRTDSLYLQEHLLNLAIRSGHPDVPGLVHEASRRGDPRVLEYFDRTRASGKAELLKAYREGPPPVRVEAARQLYSGELTATDRDGLARQYLAAGPAVRAALADIIVEEARTPGGFALLRQVISQDQKQDRAQRWLAVGLSGLPGGPHALAELLRGPKPRWLRADVVREFCRADDPDLLELCWTAARIGGPEEFQAVLAAMDEALAAMGPVGQRLSTAARAWSSSLTPAKLRAFAPERRDELALRLARAAGDGGGRPLEPASLQKLVK